MYSYGSSSRGSKQGHGGRNYRPPPERRDPGTVPPPLKLCHCLIELDVPEYAVPQPQGRTHASFGGKKQVDLLIGVMRSVYCCHLEIPGRTKGGPVGVVGASVRNVIPACHYLLQSLAVNRIQARIHRDVKLGQTFLEGTFVKLEKEFGNLFESNAYTVAVCKADSPSKLDMLSTCLDNFQFQNGNQKLELYMSLDTVFAAGTNDHIHRLLDEVVNAQTWNRGA